MLTFLAPSKSTVNELQYFSNAIEATTEYIYLKQYTELRMFLVVKFYKERAPIESTYMAIEHKHIY